MEEFLSSHEIALSVAHNGFEGLTRALEGAFDLVILDVMLPSMNGFDVLRQLRRRSAVPVIMLTACADDEKKIEGLNAGADDTWLSHLVPMNCWPAYKRCFAGWGE